MAAPFWNESEASFLAVRRWVMAKWMAPGRCLALYAFPQAPGGRIRALGFAPTRARGRSRVPIPPICRSFARRYHAFPQAPGGRIRALGFAPTRARGRSRVPIPPICRSFARRYHAFPQTPGGRIRASMPPIVGGGARADQRPRPRALMQTADTGYGAIDPDQQKRELGTWAGDEAADGPWWNRMPSASMSSAVSSR